MRRTILIAILMLILAGFAIADTTIQSPASNQTVPRIVIVDGNSTGDEFLWILVGPSQTPGDWWPQKGGPLSFDNGNFSGSAFLGGQMGDEFQIAVLQANDSINEQILRWVKACNSSDYWPPITKEDAAIGFMIPREEIEESIGDRVLVILEE